MKDLSWVGTAISAIAGFVNPWLSALGMVIILLITVVYCTRDVLVAYITTNPAVKQDKNSKKHNKKNR